MPLSYAQYTGNGSTTTFSVPFPYLLKSHVKLYTGFNILDGTYASLLTEGTDYSWTSGTQVQTTVAPANGVKLTVIRETPDTSQLVPWQDGSNLVADDLNNADLQNLYVVQEQQDRNDAGITQSTSAITAANSATAASTTATTTANTALSTANTALSTANAASSTASTASSNASAAVSTANTAASDASAAVATANAASSTATTASTNASNAVTTANAAAADAATALSTANTAASNASAAVSTANTASSNASAAVSTANTASSNASAAVSTANTASSNASTALSTANTASSNATTAVNTANAADTKANAAIAAVASSINYTPVADVASIPGSPANDTYIEVTDTTGLESFTPLSGAPSGFAGDAGLTARLRYTTTGNTWVWLNYFANNADVRYLKRSGGTMAGKITLDGDPSSNLHAATKQYVDSADATLTSAVSAAQATADAALPKAGGTMTGNITFNAGQTFSTSGISAATTGAAGIVQLTDSTSSTSTTTAATPNSVKSAYDLADAALPKAGGTMTGNITFNAGQTFSTAGIAAASTSAAGIVQLSDSTSSASSSTAATSKAVKDTYDFASVVSTTANAALPKSGGLMTGAAGIIAGTASAPGLYFSGDTNTGIYSPGADQVAISTNGSGRLFVDSSGRLGVGTASPSGVFHTKITTDRNFIFNTSLGGDARITAVNDASSANVNFVLQGDNVILQTGGGAARIDSSGRVGIGTTDARGVLRLAGSSANSFPNNGGILWLTDTNAATDYKNWEVGSINGEYIVSRGSDAFNTAQFGYKITGTVTQGYIGEHIWYTNNSSEKVRIDNSGRLLVGTSTSSTGFEGQYAKLQVIGNSSGAGGGSYFTLARDEAVTGITANEMIARITFGNTGPAEFAYISCEADGAAGSGDYPGRLVFSTTADGASSPTERMRITNVGNIYIGQTLGTQGAAGIILQQNGYGNFIRNDGSCIYTNRRSNDGTLVEFAQADVTEGTISVSGTTVSYNGAHLSRWSQTPGIDPHDKTVRPEILRGTVMSNLDEMCDWIDPESGDAQDNEQLNKTKVSDVEGDKNVAGIFQSWDDDDATWVNDYYLAMTGDFVIRVAAGVTVERGDLLMSAGDGTAKPQDDDIIRSKTIAKVTSTNVSCTYDDGSYCVPCVLMAC